MQKIGILGAGACGVSAFSQIVQKLASTQQTENYEICIIEKSNRPGYGLAFGTEDENHLLNTSARLMGIDPENKGDFLKWLNDNGKLAKNTGDKDMVYVPRKLFGDYLNETFQNALKIAEQNQVNFRFIHKEARNIKQKSSQWCIDFSDKSEAIAVDHLIMALGTPRPVNYPEFESLDSYIDFPWPVSDLKPIPKNSDVGIFGTGLSAIDAVMTLTGNNHRGKITLFSPAGMMPRVQPRQKPEIELKHFTEENVKKWKQENEGTLSLKGIYKNFKKEVELQTKGDINWNSLDRTQGNAAEYLKEDTRLAEEGGDVFLKITYSMRYLADKIWEAFSDKERAAFLKIMGRHWQINRHAMPYENAQKLLTFIDRDQLAIVGGLEQEERDASRNHFLITTKDNQYTCDYLINATGSPGNPVYMNNKLIQNLLKTELIIPYPAGGVHIDRDSLEIAPQFYAVGHLVSGVFPDSNAVWFNVQQIRKIINSIVD